MTQNRKHLLKRDLGLCLLLYLASILVRLYGLGETSVYPDEITWMVRGKEFVYALIHLNPHYFETAWWTNQRFTEAIGLPLVFTNGLLHIIFAGSGKLSLQLFSDIVASRIAVSLVGAMLIPLLYLVVKDLSSYKNAFIFSLLYAMNPIVIAMDRYVLHDSYLTFFTFIAVVMFFSKSRLSHWLTGFFTSLAFLTKPTGLLVLFGWLSSFNLKLFRKSFLNTGYTVLITLLLITVLWPASWKMPFFSVFEYLWRQATLSSLGIPNFYLGHATRTPGVSYYLFQLLARIPEMIILLVLIAITDRKIRNHVVNERILKAGLLFCIVYLVVISVSPQKGGFRYLLPILPWIYVLASISYFKICKRIGNKTKIIFSVAFACTTIGGLIYYPNYYLYYNFLVGGPEGAKRYDLVGLCLGNKAAIKYLDTNNLKGSIAVLGCPDTVSYHTQRELVTNENADYVIVESAFAQQFPSHQALDYVKSLKPISTVIENNTKTAQIYAKY